MLRIKNPYTKHCRIANPAERKGSLAEHKREPAEHKGSLAEHKREPTEHKREPAERKGFFWGTEGELLGGLRDVRKARKFKERTAEQVFLTYYPANIYL